MLLIFDKDGTLTIPKSGENFCKHPKDQIEVPGTSEYLRRLAKNNSIFIASNQGGIGKYKSQEFALEEFSYVLELFPEVEKFFYAPGRGDYTIAGYLDENKNLKYDSISYPWISNYRKPETGMLEAIAFEKDASTKDIIYCGDRETDYNCAKNFGCKFYWQFKINEMAKIL